MTPDEFKSLKAGTILYGFHKGSHFAATIKRIDNDNSILLYYPSGQVKRWSKHHIIKYYSLRSFQHHAVSQTQPPTVTQDE